MDRILVWDLPTRLGHWLLALGFALAWLTSESENLRMVLVVAGGLVVSVVVFRLAWGFVGSTYARFESFVDRPRAAFTYVKSLLGERPAHFTGHNPAGGYAILALLALALLAGITGWINYQDLAGDWLAEMHEAIASAMLAVVVVHLLGVAVGSWRHKENLARAMIDGCKRGRPEEAITSARVAAVITLIVCAVAGTWLLSL